MIDEKTMGWLISQIDEAPNKQCLEGITYTLDFLYSIDKDLETLEYFMKRINEAKKLKD
jgi:hypothetical protein